MMETIRRGTDSTIMKVVFGAIVLVFVFWGVTPQGNRGQLIAEVNGERITDTEYRRVMSRMQGTSNMDDDELSDLGREVVQQLIRQRVQIQEAERVGLVVSIQEIAREIRKSAAFRTDEGKFSEKVYASVLKHSGMSKGQYEEQLRESILQNKLRQLALSSVQVSDAEVERFFEASFTDVTVAWVRLGDDELLERVPVTDAEIDEWITTHPDELKEAYDKAFNTRWSKPRRADVSTILLRTDLDQGRVPEEDLRARLDAIRAQATGGADFAELARRHSEDLATALLEESGLSVVTSGPFKPAQPRLIGLGSSPTFEAAIAGASSPGVLPGVYPTLGGRVVGAVTALEQPDPAMLETTRDFIFGQLLSQRREEFMQRYVDDLVSTARVENVYNP
jgi:peptidyl-prolyl cis-trans isomerase D